MANYFCPRCWSELHEDRERCPRCNLNISEYLAGTDYIERLINSLRHPVADLRRWAAYLLGQLRDERAVRPLMALVRNEKEDLYVVRQAVRSLGLIGGHEVDEFLQTLLAHPARMIRKDVERLLESASEVNSE